MASGTQNSGAGAGAMLGSSGNVAHDLDMSLGLHPLVGGIPLAHLSFSPDNSLLDFDAEYANHGIAVPVPNAPAAFPMPGMLGAGGFPPAPEPKGAGVSKKWCFTINHPTVADKTSFRPGVYGMAQVECGALGTEHLQGFCILATAARVTKMKSLHPKAHWEIMRGSLEQNEAYCSKDDTATSPPQRWTWGSRPVGQGKRTDLHDLADLVVKGGAALAAQEMPHMVLKFPAGIRMLAQLRPVPVVVPPPAEWRPWQKELLAVLATPADDRTIWWYVDPTGGAGKSTLVRTVVGTGDPCTATALSGRVADMAFAYQSEKAVFFDVSRTMAENVKHLAQFAEQLKNGMFFSTKYESVLKRFPSPHVVFFSNSEPPQGLWSADRCKLVHLSVAEPFAATSPALPAVGGKACEGCGKTIFTAYMNCEDCM